MDFKIQICNRNYENPGYYYEWAKSILVQRMRKMDIFWDFGTRNGQNPVLCQERRIAENEFV